MGPILKLAALLVCLVCAGFSQTLKYNVQFKDTDGREYDLYDLLDEGKFVFCHFMDCG